MEKEPTKAKWKNLTGPGGWSGIGDLEPVNIKNKELKVQSSCLPLLENTSVSNSFELTLQRIFQFITPVVSRQF